MNQASPAGRAKVTGRDVAVAVGVGVAVAGLAGLAAGAALGTGLVALASSSRRSKRALKPPAVQRDEEGRVLGWQELLREVQRGGIAPELRPELWPLLLGVYSPGSSEDERLATLAQLRALYTKLVLVCQELDQEVEAAKQQQQQQQQRGGLGIGSGPSGSGPRGGGGEGAEGSGAAGAAPAAVAAVPEPVPGNLAAFAEAHRIIVMDAVRTDFARAPVALAGDGSGGGGGCGNDAGGGFGSPTVTVLPVAVIDGIPEIVLVEHAAPPAQQAEQAAQQQGVHGGYTPLWTSRLAEETLAAATHVSEHSRAQMLRLINLLSAYAVRDPEIGYCQGMSDLASVFIQMFEDDALAFACFEALMKNARRNFKHDETGIKQQLRAVGRILEHTDPPLYQQLCRLGAEDCMFVFRMLIVMLRRELSPEHAATLWEIGFAHEAAAALEAQTAAVAGPSGASRSLSRSSSGGGGAGGGGINSRTSSGALAAAAAAAGAAAAPGELGAGSGRGSAGALVRPGSASSFSGGGGAAAAEVEAAVAADGDFQHWFIAAAVRAQRRRVLGECHDTDDVLRLFNGVQIDFWATLQQAERSFRRYAQGAAVMRRL